MGKKGRTKRKSLTAIFAVVAAVAAIFAGILIGANTGIGFIGDRQAQDGQLDPNAGAEDIEKALQERAEQSMFSLRINTRPEFETGSSEGVLLIENPPTNTYLMQVTITLDDTGETVYSTGMLKPNSNIAKDSLDVALKKGSYAATAMFTAYEPETREEVGKTAAAMTIIIKN